MVNTTAVGQPKELKKESIKPVTLQSKDYDKINQLDSFNKLVRKKNTFLFGTTAVFLILYILLPILAFTPVLQQKWIGNITGVWVYSAGLFVMTVILCMVYTKMAPKFDKMVVNVLEEFEKQGGKK